jgi:serine protease Do
LPEPPAANERGYVGVNICEVTDADARRLGVAARSGAVIAKVFPDSPAEKAGLRPGDVVVRCDGVAIQNCARLTTILGVSRPEAKHTLDFYRGRRAYCVQMTLETWPAEYR